MVKKYSMYLDIHTTFYNIRILVNSSCAVAKSVKIAVGVRLTRFLQGEKNNGEKYRNQEVC
jgi:hypothetical protein